MSLLIFKKILDKILFFIQDKADAGHDACRTRCVQDRMHAGPDAGHDACRTGCGTRCMQDRMRAGPDAGHDACRTECMQDRMKTGQFVWRDHGQINVTPIVFSSSLTFFCIPSDNLSEQLFKLEEKFAVHCEHCHCLGLEKHT